MKRLLVLAAAALVAGCAAISASNEPARDEAMFAAVRPGMTMDEVRARLGPPSDTMPFAPSRTLAWDYRFADAWGYMALFSVIFDAQGRVATTQTQRLNTGGDHR
jgi:outer membrane protein assembly factor BamE (lipoprotein component of BamABCDE complex)